MATKVSPAQAVANLDDKQLSDLRAVFRSMAVLNAEELALRDAIKAEQAKRRLAKDSKRGAELLKKLL